jgi:hypothetical protein
VILSSTFIYFNIQALTLGCVGSREMLDGGYSRLRGLVAPGSHKAAGSGKGGAKYQETFIYHVLLLPS